MKELNKTEQKFIKNLLNNKIKESEMYIKKNKENFLNPNLPNYTDEVYQKNIAQNQEVINRCKSILEKI